MKAILYTLVVLAALYAVPAKAQTIRYVDLQATGANTGTSWANAFVQLQQAIDAAAPSDQIWVAQGRYLPTVIFNGTAFNRSKTFFVSKNISIYGGFAGTETALSQRNPDLQLTILSGDLDNNDLDPDGNHIAEDAGQVIGDNAHHVLWIEKVDSTCLIDGFTITAGLATGSQTNDSQNGGGIYNNASGAGQRSNPKFRNCVFSANRSSFFGAILYNNARQYGTASPQFEHCIFRKNKGIFGGLYNDATFGGTANPVLEHCLFLENEAQHGGAAIWIEAAFFGASVSPLLRHCVFTKNFGGFGSILFSNTLDNNSLSAPQFVNSTFCENEAGFGGVFHFTNGNESLATPLFLNCLFVANKATFGAVGNIGNAGTARIQWTNCSFYGNQSNYGNVLRLDNGKDTTLLETTFSNCIFRTNTGGGSGTIYLHTTSTPVNPRMEHALLDAGACPPGILCGSGMLYNQNPQFIDPANRNFRLQAGSPAINSGSNSALPPGTQTDLDGNARLLAGTVDLGPYESGGTPPATLVVQVSTNNNNCQSSEESSATALVQGGTPPYAYLWSTGAATPSINNLPAGTYTVTVFDGSNCPVSATATILNAPPIEVQTMVQHATCSNSNNGQLSLNVSGGTGGYTYLWSNNAASPVLNNLPAGTYTVTVTDAKGCQRTTSATIAAPAPIQISLITTPVTCPGAGDGTISSNASGGTSPYQYLWSTNVSTPGLSNLPGGTYTLTITDANNCQSTSSAVITKPVPLVLQIITLIPAACTGAGTVEAGASGGTPPYVYSWSNGASGPVAGNLPAGQYSLTLTDAAGCSTSTSATVSGGTADTEAPQLIAGNADVPLGSSGMVQLTLELLGATATDNCLVSEVLIEPSIFDCSETGEHPVVITVVDPSGNQTQTTITVTISDKTPPVLSCPADVQRCPADNPVYYEAPVATDNCLHMGGSGSGWSLLEGLPSGAAFPVGASTPVVYAYTDGSGNVGTCSFTVTISPMVQVQVDAVWPDIGNQGNGAIQVTLLGGMPPFALAWYRDGELVSTQEDPTGLPSGYYELRVTDAGGCLFVPEIIFVDQLVRTSEPDWVAGIQMQPNPTRGITRIVLPESWDDSVVLNIVDATGRLVETLTDIQLPAADLDCSGLPTGVYALVFQSASRRGVRQLVVQR